ncbi:Signal recognition particle GTPase [Levilactobacillus koreensis JCM 16448]|uniref:Signal recognition particle receptor FtsY n=1 Tax=Levilactobacillus koreensis TaxID=637971 RepID=A0AAC8UX66_9LACO|nr:signal recognition particle-docking protein FtsY [Levilactobacillus koreensis]AKP65883.1 cell division protein FtsY [Levilactobacillus koreensis]KRK90352.1 Signal recognition particle GTPase [Levilactobacillus koreensis JCM 16448]
MGLFDIFRRRAKPASEAPKPESEAEPFESAAATSENAASEASATSEVEKSEAPVGASASEASETAIPQSADDEKPAATTVSSAVTETPKAPASEAEGTGAVVEQSVASIPVAKAATEPESEPEATSAAAPVAQSAVGAETPASEATVEASEKTATEQPADTPSETATATPTEPAEKPVTDEQLYDKGLEKTRTTFGQRLNALLANFRHVDESFFDDLEETLIGADVGFDMAVKLSDELRDEVKLQNAKKPQDVQNVVVEKLVEIYDAAGNDESTALNMAPAGPTVILFVGVNGVGKTTTIGKMANRFHQAGKKVLLAAADTFRAGATEQLDVWAKRADVDIVTGKPQSDPAAVVFDAVKKAKDEDYDILFVDTAGRLQNKVNLMNELAKMKRIITREIPAAPHEVLLVLDATTGQNALTQAKLFKESTDVTGIVLTKLDGTARGGIVLAIRNELHVPVKFIGLGEQISDLRPFDPNEFVYGLFKGLIDVKALDKK